MESFAYFNADIKGVEGMSIDTEVRIKKELFFSMPSDSQEIQCSVEKICTCLGNGTNEGGMYCFALSEMLANAIEHGNLMQRDKRVTVEVLRYRCHYKITITDEGQGFDWRSRYYRELDLSGESDRGRGIIMSRMMSNALIYNNIGNQVTIIVAIN